MDILWTILSWIVFGGIIGAIARLLVPGEQAIGCVMTVILGVIGSFVGGTLGSLIFTQTLTFKSPAGWIGSLIGAVIVLLIYVKFFGKKAG